MDALLVVVAVRCALPTSVFVPCLFSCFQDFNFLVGRWEDSPLQIPSDMVTRGDKTETDRRKAILLLLYTYSFREVLTVTFSEKVACVFGRKSPHFFVL